MATVKLGWRELSTTDGGAIHRFEVRARNGGGALFMEVYDRGRAVIRLYNVTAYYWLEDSRRGILLYDEKGFRGLDDARTALTQKGVGATYIFRSLIMTSPEDRTGPLTRPAVLETSSGNETPCLPY